MATIKLVTRYHRNKLLATIGLVPSYCIIGTSYWLPLDWFPVITGQVIAYHWTGSQLSYEQVIGFHWTCSQLSLGKLLGTTGLVPSYHTSKLLASTGLVPSYHRSKLLAATGLVPSYHWASYLLPLDWFPVITGQVIGCHWTGSQLSYEQVIGYHWTGSQLS